MFVPGKILLLLFATSVSISHTAFAFDISPFSTDIKATRQASHIAGITKDKVVVIAGSTFRFTVDTPEDQGLVSTRPTVKQLLQQLTSKDNSIQRYAIIDKAGNAKNEGDIISGDRLLVTSENGKARKIYQLDVRQIALSGQLNLQQQSITVNTKKDLTLYFTAGQRSPDATVKIYLPAGIHATMENTTVNVIGRGNVTLKELGQQSIGRTGTKYSYSKVGAVTITPLTNGGSLLTFSHLDLRPANGADLKMVISNVSLPKTGNYVFKATYTTSKPEVLTSAGTGTETTTLEVTPTVSDFARVAGRSLQYREEATTYNTVHFTWGAMPASNVVLLQSVNNSCHYGPARATIDIKTGSATVTGLEPDQWYKFRLLVKDGKHKGFSNIIEYYSGKLDIKSFDVAGDSSKDYTKEINYAIEYLSRLGGGTLLFSKGVYSVRTVHLKSNVYLYIDKEATIKALKGADAPEVTWFSDKKYRSGLSPTDAGPYADPENYLTKQDVGHHYFRNSMFFGERLDNVKIIGNGRITGNGNIVTGDRVMDNAPDNRADKMFTFKLCTNIEIGGIYRDADLWYDSSKDEPYYISKNGSQDFNTDNMLHIDRSGHFALLATGTDFINVHNTYFSKHSTSNVRDIYDFMACSHVTVTNIYSKVSSDDIVKPGSDCSLGFTRPASDYKVRNVIGDTNCNLFQIGSETADDIMDICVDNIYILGSNKAGFSISTNDGGYIKNIHLNCGHTGSLHARSKMYRTFAPFFISISNRGRIIGAEVGKYAFTDNGEPHNELLVKNVNIGQVENILLNGIDIYEVYAGSSFNGKRWAGYDGKQRRATPIIAGYSLPATEQVTGGLNFTLPNGKHTGYIKNVVFNDVHVLVKGGNPLADTAATPPELGVGQYNASNLKVQPSFGLWARHVKDLTVKASSFRYEKPDSRYALLLDDVIGAQISGVKMVRPADNPTGIKLKNASDIHIENVSYYEQ
ncbi:endopygalactorunase [Niastella caeni]|uniref:endopygalactorunase n=1 Tax=Niastella caeni TaxID=2569763 RepID=UPI001FB75ED4|nr:endopygalactorunase [Niastella caeni]